MDSPTGSTVQAHRSDIDRITLWIRPSPRAPAPNRERALRLASRLDRAGAVDVEVERWGRVVDRSDALETAFDGLADTVDAFVRWAERAGRSLDPFFRTRRFEETLLTDACEIRRLPTVALAEYVDGDLVHVAPSRSADRVVDVVSRLEPLAEAVTGEGRDASERGATG